MSNLRKLNGRIIGRGVVAATTAVAMQMAVRHAVALNAVNFTGTYTQNFDGLPYNTDGTDVALSSSPVINGAPPYTLPAAGTPFDLSTSLSTSQITSLAGWYGVGAAKDAFGANGGSTTQGGIYSFGAPAGTDRALGLIAASGSGIDEIGVLLYNNTTTTYNQISLSYNAELWHQGTASKTLNFGYALQSTATALPTTGLTMVSGLNAGGFAIGTAVQGSDGTSPVATTAVSSSGLNISNWAPNTYLWLTWTINSAAGSGQGIGIDDLNFSAASVFPPATVTWNTTTGTWDTATGNFTGGTPTPNSFKTGDNAVFGNIASNSVITINGDGVTTTTVSPTSLTISNASNTYTFQGGAIGGSASVTMTGTGTAVFKSTNTYTGGTILNSGTLVVDGGDDRLGAAAGGITFAGGTLQTNTVGITSTRSITVNTGGGTFNTNGLASSSSGSVSVNDAFRIVGGGNLTLTGGITMAATGSINVGNPTATTLDPTTLTLGQASGTIDLGSNGGTINGNIVVTGGIRVNFSQGVFATTVTSGPKPEIQIQSSDTYVNDPMNGPSLTGGPFISNTSGTPGGTVGIDIHLNSMASNSSQFTRTDVTGAGLIAFPSTNAFIATIGGTKGPKVNGSTTHQGNLVINGVISGFADLNISNSPTSGGGSGDVTLNAQNTYTGITMDNSNDSTLYIGVDNALPVGTDLIFGTLAGFGSPTVDLNGHNQTINSLSFGLVGSAAGVSITNTGTANSVLTVGSPTSTTTPGHDFGGVIKDGVDRVDQTTPRALGLVKNGSGTLVLSGVYTAASINTYSGGTTIKGGVLQVPNDAGLGASTGALTFDGGALSFADSADGVTSITTSSDRPLRVTSNGGTINTVCVDATSTTNTTDVTFTGVGGYNWAGTAANPLNIVGGSGSVTINGGAGTVSVTAGATIAVKAAATLNAGGTSDPFTDSSDATKHVSIVNNGAFNITQGVKAIGSLSGTGNTFVTSGTTLLVNSDVASGASGQTVTLNGGTFGGHGTVLGNVVMGTGSNVIAPSATLAANVAGTLTMNGLTTNSVTTLKFNLVTPNTAGGSDLIHVTGAGALVLNGGIVDVSNHGTGAASLGYYKVMQYSGGIGGTGLSSLSLPAVANGVSYQFDTTHDPGFVDIHRGYLGDTNDSGFVDLTDLTTLAGNWQQSGGWAQGDFDGSGFVDLTDLTILAGNWQTGIGSFGEAASALDTGNASWQAAVQSVVFSASVPEPTSLALLGLGAAGLMARRRRK